MEKLIGKTLPLIPKPKPRIFGPVKLDTNADFNPQVIQYNDYSELDDIVSLSSSSTISDDPPSSWGSNSSFDFISNRLIEERNCLTAQDDYPNADWTSSNNDFEDSCEFPSRRRNRSFKLAVAPKYASESNIEDALVMLEPGLRKIPKDTNFTTSEEDSTNLSSNGYIIAKDDSSEHQVNDESGFFSYQDNHSINKHVTVITINQDTHDSGDNDKYKINLLVKGEDIDVAINEAEENTMVLETETFTFLDNFCTVYLYLLFQLS